MPTVPKQQVPAKQSSESQEQDISKQFTVKAHGVAVVNIQRWLLENEKYYKELQSMKAKSERNKARINNLESENRGLKADLHARTSEVRNFAEVNGDLKVDLLKHQRMSQVADSQIVDMYKLLHANISSWVDAEVVAFEERWRAEHDDQYPQSEVFQHGNIPAYIDFLKAGYQFGGEYLVESQIHMRLHDLLFKKDQPFAALNQNETDFMHNFEAGLATLDPPRAFQQRRPIWMTRVGPSILCSAEKILPSCHEDEHQKRQESFQLQVLEPAFDLAVAMKTSSVCYEFTECFTRETQLKTVPMKNYHYDYCTMIDIDTRKSLKKIGKGRNGDKAIGANQVLMLAPGLIRRADDDTKKLTPEM
ncbi:MAG: hypothetical protein Q9192_008034, partial [Flavoplaca navasiana]